MNSFKLKNAGVAKYTSVPNCFIEKYMPLAAGEFTKIYIYLLKCIGENQCDLSISKIADVFNDTEKDVIRALKYWEKKGLLKLTFDENILTALTLTITPEGEVAQDREEAIEVRVNKPESAQEEEPAASEDAGSDDKEDAKKTFTRRQYSKAEVYEFSEKDDTQEMIFVAQKLLGKQLTGSEINTVMFFCCDLGFKPDLVEYLFEYCANAGHRNMRYIEKTAIAWASEGITDVSAAKTCSGIYSENCYPVMKAFGLSGRRPAASEMEYINRWTLSYGFDTKMIVEACSRTISTIHQPSFEYADRILYNWKSRDVKTIEDVRADDIEFGSRKKTKKTPAPNAAAASSSVFNSFDQRDYDFDDLKKQLLKSQG